tara:strand:- start:148 stop:381 length:234 start_codon:yes stop_codon:yes gene_type:complete
MAYKVYNLAGEVIETIEDSVAIARKQNCDENEHGCNNWEGKGNCFIYEQTQQADLLSELQAKFGSVDDGKTYIFEKQ